MKRTVLLDEINVLKRTKLPVTAYAWREEMAKKASCKSRPREVDDMMQKSSDTKKGDILLSINTTS
ncbi:hypothetical protein GW17_00003959 [Ensete ventricosum]|nr:hypothetical protein GW17_00003959 [Ensete ventricosum]